MDENGDFVPFETGGADTSDGTITPGTVLSGYVGYSQGERIVGTYVPIDTSDATATAKNIESGYTAYVNGVKITGIATVTHGLVKYSGNVDDLSKARSMVGCVSRKNRDVVFAGGLDSSSYSSNSIDAYNTSLSRSTPNTLSSSRYSISSIDLGEYAIFLAGAGWSNKLEIFDGNFTRVRDTTYASYNDGRSYYACTNLNDMYALFGASTASNNSSYLAQSLIVYDSSLAYKSAPSLSQARIKSTATSTSSYAIFAGGQYNYNAISERDTVDAYSTSLTLSNPAVLSTPKHGIASTTLNNIAIFAGGAINDYASYTNTVDAYNNSLTKQTISNISSARMDMVAVSIDNYALFAGNGGSSTIVDYFDVSLTRKLTDELTYVMSGGGSINNFALFSGSYNPKTTLVDVYTEV